jgi:cardiolipin synthase A/B
MTRQRPSWQRFGRWLFKGALLLAGAQLAAAGCCQLPVIVPDLARSAPPARTPVQVVGADGPLSPARSRAVLQRLARQGDATDIFDRHLAREEALVGSPLTIGNEVLLLQDGPATYRAMLEAIDGARDHIHMETYILDDDEVGQLFARALAARQRQGVQVLLIRDSAGTIGTPSAFFESLAGSGVQELFARSWEYWL